MWNLPRPGIKSVSPALAGRFLTTAPSGKSRLIGFFSSMLFSLHVVFFWSFLLLRFFSSFMPLWSEKMLEVISILLTLLRLVLCPGMCPVLENVPCALEKNVYSVFLDVMSWKYQLSLTVVSFRTSVALLIFLSRRRVHWYECGVKVSYYYCIPFNFPFYGCYDLPYVLRCSYVGCIFTIVISSSWFDPLIIM